MTKSTQTTSDWMSQGAVWVAPIWHHTKKKFVGRPVVIVGNDAANDKIGLIVNFATTQGKRDEFDVELDHWDEAGFDELSWVRTAKPLTILKKDLKRNLVEKDGKQVPKGYIGKLNDEDLKKVLNKCREIY